VSDIKYKFFLLVIFILIISIFFPISTLDTCKAEDQVGVYIVGEPSYQLKKSIIKNNKLIGQTYQINVTLYNSGYSRSVEFIVNLTDEDGSLKKNISLEPGETKVVSFTWSTIKIKKQRLIINFYPSDLDVIRTKYNSGSKSLTINIKDNAQLPATSTPGFEIILVLIAICIVIVRKNFNK
jgi:hypothetical protein